MTESEREEKLPVYFEAFKSKTIYSPCRTLDNRGQWMTFRRWG